MYYKLDRCIIEFYNISRFSLEDKIRNLFGEVRFYNGNNEGGGMVEEKRESEPKVKELHISKELRERFKRERNEYARRHIELIRKWRAESSKSLSF